MRIVAISGSPRPGGNVDSALTEILRGAEAQGAECELIRIQDQDISFCTSCMRCRKKPDCSIQDDMAAIIEKVAAADAVILGTPIYICQTSAQMKTLMDRFYPLTNENHKPRYGTKKLVMLYTYGVPIPFVFSRYTRYNGKTLKYMGLKLHKNIVIPGATTKGFVANNQKLLKKLHKVGQILAS